MRPVFLFALLLCCLFAVCAVFPAQAQSAAPEAVFALEPYSKTVALRATVGGQKGLFVFDTGGGLSSLTPAFAAKIGVKPWGRLTGFQMMGSRLDMPQVNNIPVVLGTQRFTAPVTGVFDLMSLYPKDAQPVDGMLALDVFAGKVITIDFPAKRLIVESSASLRARIIKATPLPMHVARELQGRALAVSVGVPTSRGPIWMELDSGNGGTILISKPYAALFGLDVAKEGPQTVTFALANNLRVSGSAFAPDMIIEGNIGMPFLKDAVVTLDLSRNQLWVRQETSQARRN